MSIQSEIKRLNNNVKNSYEELSKMGLTALPPQNSDHLPQAIANMSGIIDDKIAVHNNSKQSHSDIRDELKQKASLQEVYDKETICSLYPEVPITMTGAAVSTDMVSPVEHEVKCKVSGVDDPTTVAVSRFGKNLIKSAKISGGFGPGFIDYHINLPKGTYSFNEEFKVFDVIRVHYNDSSGEQIKKVSGANSISFTTNKYSKIFILTYKDGNRYDGKGQIEIGDKATEYEVGITPEVFHPSSDGTVTGMKSSSPNMTITTDNSGANLEIMYNADTKKYIEENGALTSEQLKEAHYLENNRQKDFISKTFAPAIPVTMTGTVVSTDMVSPVEHDVECRVSSDTVQDLSTVTITQTDKSLIDFSKMIIKNEGNAKIVNNRNGSYTISGNGNISGPVYNELVIRKESLSGLKPGSYKLCFGAVTNPYFTVSFRGDSSGSYIFLSNEKSIETTFSLTSKLINSKEFRIVFYTSSEDSALIKPGLVTPTVCKISNTFVPSSDGTVSGMKSISPNMTILTDNPGATIEATYNADTKKYVENKGGAVIDDSTTSPMKTWSSQKMVDTFYGHIPVTKTGKTITVSDASPVQSPIVCNVSGASDLSSTIVRRYGKNIFDVGFRSKGNFADWENPIRDFDLTKYYLSVGTDNLAAWRNPDMVTAIISDNKINVKSSEYAGHGLGVPVPCKPNTTYTFGYTAEPTIKPRCSFYTMGGEFIESYTGNTFTTPSNCGIVLLLLVVGATKDVTFSNIYFYEGKNQGYLPTNRQYIRPEPDGTVNGMVSAGSNSLNILSDGTVTITATYDADLQAHINIKTAQVTDAILSLGGNV